MSVQSSLADLDLHWGEVYEIWHDPDRWVALYRGETWNPALLADTAAELRALIRADYGRRTQNTARPGLRGARAGGRLRLITGGERS